MRRDDNENLALSKRLYEQIMPAHAWVVGVYAAYCAANAYHGMGSLTGGDEAFATQELISQSGVREQRGSTPDPRSDRQGPEYDRRNESFEHHASGDPGAVERVVPQIEHTLEHALGKVVRR